MALDIELKQDSPEKLAYAEGKPTKHFLFASEVNKIVQELESVIGKVDAVPNPVTGEPSTLAQALIDLHEEATSQEGDPVNLGYEPHAEKIIVTNSAGTDAIIPAASEVRAGAMLPGDVTKLSGIESEAQKNVKPDWSAAPGSPAEILNKPNLAILIPNRLLNIGEVTLEGNTLSVSEPEEGNTYIWNGLIMAASEFETEIAAAGAEQYRTDVLAIGPDGFEIVQGEANYLTWKEPTLPPGYIRVTPINVYGGAVEELPPVLIGFEYVTKASMEVVTVAGAGIVESLPLLGHNTLRLTGNITELRSLFHPSDQANIYSGARLVVLNHQATPVALPNLSGTGNLKFEFFSGQPKIIAPGASAEFLISGDKALSLDAVATASGGVKVLHFDRSHFAPVSGTTAITIQNVTIPAGFVKAKCLMRITVKYKAVSVTNTSKFAYMMMNSLNVNNNLVHNYIAFGNTAAADEKMTVLRDCLIDGGKLEVLSAHTQFHDFTKAEDPGRPDHKFDFNPAIDNTLNVALRVDDATFQDSAQVDSVTIEILS